MGAMLRGAGVLVFVLAIVAQLACAPAAASTVSPVAWSANERPPIEDGTPDPLSCTVRATPPEIDNVVAAAWSPDSTTLA
ncbi:MAG TPA: hypothetical protein DCK98_03460, partial [Chloroflexi bacterium]|nr:hypothetical protein [Chloroflexota bacterium]